MVSRKGKEARADPIMSRQPVLATKIVAPPNRSVAVERSALFEQLDRGLTTRLTVLTAPPGFGKTTLLAEWLSRPAAPPAAWLTVDEADDDVARFLNHLVAAIETVHPEVGDNALNLLRPPDPAAPRAVLTALINDLLTRERGEFVLVLDDFDRITAPAPHEAVAFLLDHLPEKMHVYLAARSEPGFRLALLRARGQLNELSSNDLRFDPGESQEFCNEVMGLGLTDNDLAELNQRVEGWPAGLQLAALALKSGDGDVEALVSEFDGSHRYVVDYLADEVLRKQPAEIQHFLLLTSVLERLSAPLCDAVADAEGSQAILERLQDMNLFIQALDGARSQFRYHPLFASFLRERLQRENPQLHGAAQRRAAAWFASEGFVAEAVAHAIEGEDVDLAIQLIETSAPDLIRDLEWARLASWFEGMPESALIERPELMLTYVRALAITHELGRASALLGRLEESLREREDRENLGRARSVAAYISSRAGDQATAIVVGEEALRLLPEDATWARSQTLWAMGTAYEFQGDLPSATSRYIEAIETSERGPGFAPNWVAIVDLAYAQFEQGHLHEGARIFQQVLQGTDESKAAPPIVGVAYGELGELAREWNQLDRAEDYLGSALTLLGSWGNILALARVYRYLAKVRLARGDVEGAIAVSDQGEEVARKRGVAYAGNLAAARARFWLVAGQLDRATAWARDSGLEPTDDLSSISHLKELEYLALADVLAAQRKYSEAVDLLSRLEEASRQAGRGRNLVQIMAQRSVALSASGNQVGALRLLQDTLAVAQPEDYVRTFIDKGPRMRDLLTRLLAGGIRLGLEPYARRIHGLFPASANDVDGRSANLLSEREFEVLDLLERGLTNQQIAEEIVVTEGTVKRHVHNIFQKLNVHSRTQALARARRLNLLSS
ncbi:MAG TPA: LuxR C-terminal-related transcriptional regulator [Dehalococcoidia bacterium]|nr:LuxR C-terminal-related transcriptional regulator [Dehalococcoidia bacterium]